MDESPTKALQPGQMNIILANTNGIEGISSLCWTLISEVPNSKIPTIYWWVWASRHCLLARARPHAGRQPRGP
jgi:hypothetical protein